MDPCPARMPTTLVLWCRGAELGPAGVSMLHSRWPPSPPRHLQPDRGGQQEQNVREEEDAQKRRRRKARAEGRERRKNTCWHPELFFFLPESRPVLAKSFSVFNEFRLPSPCRPQRRWNISKSRREGVARKGLGNKIKLKKKKNRKKRLLFKSHFASPPRAGREHGSCQSPPPMCLAFAALLMTLEIC